MKYQIALITVQSEFLELYYEADTPDLARAQCQASVNNLGRILDVTEVV